ncbi:hypothetical protein [Ammoniphilus sp. 3BR4]|uniref:hypothetical protein n=1 Tax=Ammoniphilus sp. 3BR4 TaxID=3158265 RepID=UPI003467496A
MNRYSKQQILHIIDLMRMDSNNFNDVVSMEFRDQLIKDYGLTHKEIDIIELTLSKAYRNIYELLCE